MEDKSMALVVQAVPVSKTRIWAPRIITALVGSFLVLDAVMKFVKPAPVVEAFAQVGWPLTVSVGLGVVLLSCTALYAIPRSSISGAILLTGYLGGAVATHLRVGDPLLSHVLFPVYLGVLLWAGLFVRDDRLRDMIPLRRKSQHGD
jgi:hypothetical protein